MKKYERDNLIDAIQSLIQTLHNDIRDLGELEDEELEEFTLEDYQKTLVDDIYNNL